MACLRSWLPSLASELTTLDEASSLAHVLERLTLHLQLFVGQSVSFAQTRRGDRLGRYWVVVEYQHEVVGMACLQTAVEMCRAAERGQSFALAEDMKHIRQLADEVQTGSCTRVFATKNEDRSCVRRARTVVVAGSRAHTAGHCLAVLLSESGQRVGRASSDGIFFAGRKANRENATAYDKAQAVLRNDLVEVAILEVSADDLQREGLGCDHCDVVLLTDPPGRTESEAEDACAALVHSLASHGKVVLNADDPPPLGERAYEADRLIWFASDEDNERVAEHRLAGGTAVFLCADSLVIANGANEQRLPFGGRAVEREPRDQLALLAALAGAMSMNQCGDEKPVDPSPSRARREMMLSAL
jgi:hypothetical protein